MLHILNLLSLALAWDYSNQETWVGNCGNAPNKQSPISIDTDEDEKIDTDRKLHMVMLGETTSRTVKNTGNMIRVDANMGFVEVGYGTDLRQFQAVALEFHTPSEHQYDGVTYALEMHVIMTAIDRYIERDEPNMLILSVLYKPGRESYLMNMLDVANLPHKGASLQLPNSTSLNPRDEVWPTDQYYFYEGTATHPDYDCREDVYIYVIEEIKQAAEWQIDKFKSAFPQNNSRTIGEDAKFSVYYSSALMIALAAQFFLL